MAAETSSTKRILKLTVIKGVKLAKKDIFGASDPYVKIFVSEKRTGYINKQIQTKTIKKTLNPVWDQHFVIKVDPENEHLVLEVYDENRLTRDDFLGQISVDLSWMNDLLTEETAAIMRQPRSFTLKPRSIKSRVRGELHISLDQVAEQALSDFEHDFGVQECQRTDSVPLGSSFISGSPWVQMPSSSGSMHNQEPESKNQNDGGYTSGGRSGGGGEDGGGGDDGGDGGGEINVDSNTTVNDAGENEETTFNVEEVMPETTGDEVIVESSEIIDDGEDNDDGVIASNDDNGGEVSNGTSNQTHEDIAQASGSGSLHLDTNRILTLSRPSTLHPDSQYDSRWENDPRNHRQTRISEWQDTDGTAALPEGWEERVDANGRTFYVNHNTKTSSWLPPGLLFRGNQTPSSSSSSPSPNHLLLESTPKSGRRHIVTTEDNRERLSVSSGDEAAYDKPRNVSNAIIAISTLESSDDIGDGEGGGGGGNDDGASGSNSDPSSGAVFRILDTDENNDDDDEEDEEEEEEDEVDGGDKDEDLPTGWAMSRAPNGRTFFIDHINQTTTWDDPRKKKLSKDKDPHNLGPLPLGWEERIHIDGRVFYVDHFGKRTQWEDPRLTKLGGPAIKYSMGYKRKYDTFMVKLAKHNSMLSSKKLELVVSRANIFEDSYRLITSCPASQLKYKLWVEFEGEVGLDYGGVSKEWMNLLSKEMFNPYYGLFEYSAIDDYTLQVNPLSGLANEDHLSYFRFIGRVCAMAVYHGRLIDAYFIRPFYKMMLDRPITLKDMEAVDSEYYNSMVWMLENDPEVLELTFTVDEDVFGEMSERELIPNGKNIKVTNENKVQYIDQVIRWRFINRVRKQMTSFMKGFFEIIPKQLISIFDPNEIELLLAGLQDIDVNDWKNHTKYKGDYCINHSVIVHFWRVVYLLNNEQRSRLLQFVTGTSRVPMNGFSELYGSNGHQAFSITKWGNTNQLPRAHTCFNRLDLPPYSTFDEMKRKILFAIENSDCFDGVD